LAGNLEQGLPLRRQRAERLQFPAPFAVDDERAGQVPRTVVAHAARGPWAEEQQARELGAAQFGDLLDEVDVVLLEGFEGDGQIFNFCPISLNFAQDGRKLGNLIFGERGESARGLGLE
jgi:hypothetical protein